MPDPSPHGPLRTVFFAPGTDPDRVQAALDSGADAVVVDLADPVAPFPEDERRAAKAVVRALVEASTGPTVFVRVRDLATRRTISDVVDLAGPRLGGIMLPHIFGPDEVHGADALLDAAETLTGLPPDQLLLYPILETAQAVRRAYEIATASRRIAYMGGAISRFGDIHAALGFRWTPRGEESEFVLAKVLVDVRAAGIRYPISGIWGGARDDLDGLRAWAGRLRDLGYRGMMINVAEHVEVVHDVFTPDPADVAEWERIAAWDLDAPEAGRRGDRPAVSSVGSAKLNLEWARSIRP